MSNKTQATNDQQPEQAQQEPRAPFYLSGSMLELIMNALAQLPYAQSAPVIGDLQQQYAYLEEQGRKAQHDEAEGTGESDGESDGALTGEAEGTAE